MLSVSLLLKEMEQKLLYMLFSFSGKEWLLSRLRRLQTFKILQTYVWPLCSRVIKEDIHSSGLILKVLKEEGGQFKK